MKRLLALVAAVVSLSVGVASSSVQAGECKPQCRKHPITGQLICETPCP